MGRLFNNKPKNDQNQHTASAFFTAVCWLFILLCSGTGSRAAAQSVGAYDLINLINGMRSANGLGALSVDSALMACSQATAETMAASHMTWHIGNVSGRASSFGYNNYNACFATENFMMGSGSTTIAQIRAAWADASHMIPAQSSSYCHIGAGVASAGDGFYYYVVQAAYPAGKAGCGYASTVGSYKGSGEGGAPMLIKAVVTATPDEKGYVFHTVEDGQTLWAISEAYNVTIADLQSWNNMNNSTALDLGQKLYIPAKNQTGVTPTPYYEMTVLPTADAEGRFYHEVKSGDTFWSISELWNVPIESIYRANGMSENDTIGLGWKISIPVTATATIPPTDTPTPTPPPSETPVPETSAPAETVVQPTPTRAGFKILHLPAASAGAYIAAGVILTAMAGVIASGVFLYLRRK